MNRQWPATGMLEPFRVIAIAVLLPFLYHSADGQTLEKTRLGVSDVSFTFLPHLIAKDTGIFQKRGLQVEIIFIGGPVGTAALAAGELDYSASTDSGLPAAVQGVPIKAVLFAMKGPPFYLISQPRIKKINELLGKKVGLSRLGTSPYYASRRIFRKFGIDAEKITYIQAGSNTNRVMALTNGSLDASMLSLPTARVMIEKGFTELASPRDIGLVPHAGLIVRTAIIEKNREQVKK
jgi:ABC-type nitrate/sulfonate/bicarbonate transport system substrate-binding protein